MKARFGIFALVLTVILLPCLSEALTFTVKGVAGKVLFQKEVSSPQGTLGTLSDQTLNDALRTHVISQYTGSDAGVASINDMGSAMEVLSDTDMNAYGWCYSVDGKGSDLMSDQYRLTGAEKSLVWFYVAAEMRGGKWTSMCTPADHLPKPEDRD